MSDLAAEVVRRMRERGLTLVTAESTTGGLTGHVVVAVPGASRVFVAGVAAYGRKPKVSWLQGDAAVFETHGSVSEEAAREMARGARAAMEVDVAVSETGIASPTNNPERPGGLYWLAIDAEGYQRTERHVFPGDRVETMRACSERLLQMVIDYLDATGQGGGR